MRAAPREYIRLLDRGEQIAFLFQAADERDEGRWICRDRVKPHTTVVRVTTMSPCSIVMNAVPYA